MFFKKNIIAVLCAVLLTLFTVYVVLDTFVISRVYTLIEPAADAESTPDVAAQQSESGAETALETVDTPTDTSAAPIISADSYTDDNISITLSEVREYDTTVYAADIRVSSPEYLKTAFAQNAYGRNITEKTSTIAQSCGAILAINGDYYGTQSEGYVIRNGALYRDSAASGREDLVIWADGTFEIITEDDISASALLNDGAVQVLSFGPALVVNGEVTTSEGEEVGKAKSSNPRTAIGIIDACHYIFVVSDGRTGESAGLSLYQLSGVMRELGADIAYNLDGGGSSTLYFNGEVINNPTTGGNSIKERSVSDIVYIG